MPLFRVARTPLVGKIFTEFTSGHVPPDLTHLIGQERLDLKKLKNYKKWRKAYGNGVQCLVPRCYCVFLNRSGKVQWGWNYLLDPLYFFGALFFVLSVLYPKNARKVFCAHLVDLMTTRSLTINVVIRFFKC